MSLPRMVASTGNRQTNSRTSERVWVTAPSVAVGSWVTPSGGGIMLCRRLDGKSELSRSLHQFSKSLAIILT